MDDQDISYKCNAPHRFGTSCCHGLLLACTFNSKRCSWRRHAALAWAERHRITCARVPEVFCDHASWLPVSLHQQVVLLFFPLSLSLSRCDRHTSLESKNPVLAHLLPSLDGRLLFFFCMLPSKPCQLYLRPKLKISAQWNCTKEKAKSIQRYSPHGRANYYCGERPPLSASFSKRSTLIPLQAQVRIAEICFNSSMARRRSRSTVTFSRISCKVCHRDMMQSILWIPSN